MIEVSFHNKIGIVDFCHGKVNAMDIEFCTALIDKLEELDSSDCQAVVIGSKTKVFSAGIDLKRWLREGPDYVQPYMMKLEELFAVVFCYPKPIVADINGPAIAGGCMVAAACDCRVIEKRAKIGILESRLGVPLPMTAIEIVRHVAVPNTFRRLVSMGATYVGQKAVDVGLADCVADEESTRQSAIDAAQELAAIPGPAFRLTKKQRTEPVMRIVKQNQAQLFDQYIKIWQSEETRTAIRTYIEERLS